MDKSKFTSFPYDNTYQGDTIQYFDKKHQILFTATIYLDEDRTPPDERQDGFWPSLDPKSAGYIGPKSRRALAYHTAKAQQILDSWRNDEWYYVGIAVVASKADIDLTPLYAHALWGIESTSPAYLRSVAGDLLDECRADALEVLAKLAS